VQGQACPAPIVYVNAMLIDFDALPDKTSAGVRARMLPLDTSAWHGRDDPEGKVPFAIAAWTAIRSPSGNMGRVALARWRNTATFATIATDANRKLSAIQEVGALLLRSPSPTCGLNPSAPVRTLQGNVRHRRGMQRNRCALLREFWHL